MTPLVVLAVYPPPNLSLLDALQVGSSCGSCTSSSRGASGLPLLALHCS